MSDIQTLIKQSIQGKAAAQRQLYLQYRVKWYMICLRYGQDKHEADDIMQEGLIQIYKDLHQYDSKKSVFYTWSTRVIVHAALKYLKKHSWHKLFQDLDEVSEIEDTSETIYESLAAREMVDLIKSLPMGYRIIFSMYELEGYTHPEIAAQLDIAVGTSKSQLSKAKKMLRSKLEYQITEYAKK